MVDFSRFLGVIIVAGLTVSCANTSTPSPAPRPATAQGICSVAVPAGSYMLTCTNCQLSCDSSTCQCPFYTCSCETNSNTFRTTSIQLAPCTPPGANVAILANTNGNLVCQGQ
jgi:hypothetical protein